MEWLTTKTLEYRKQAKSCWHVWFAWHPVCVKTYKDGAVVMKWLEYVLRKGTLHHNLFEYTWIYEYKFIQNLN